MKTHLLKLGAVCSLAILTTACSKDDKEILEPTNSMNEVQADFTYGATPIANQYIVTLTPGTLGMGKEKLNSKKAYEAKAANARAKIEQTFHDIGLEQASIKNTMVYAFEGFADTLSKKQFAQLKNNPKVEKIEQDYMISLQGVAKNDSYTMAFDAADQTVPYGITRVNGGVDGTGKTAWIIDTGIDLDHPDLNVDVLRSISFIAEEPSPNDGNGHGSHVAGTIAAKDNAIGVVGVAPNASVIAVKVLSSEGSGATSGIIAALDYVAANASPGDAVNMSLGGSIPLLGIDSALDAAAINVGAQGVGVAIAAGNSSLPASLYSPARANGENVYTISAMDDTDSFASFSNWGGPVDYCDPGVNIYSTYMNGGYATLSGTSMATPHFCGLLLLGDIKTDGTVSGDPTIFSPDPIAVH